MGQHALVHTLDAFMRNIVVLTLDHGIILIVNYRKKFDTISRKNKKKPKRPYRACPFYS